MADKYTFRFATEDDFNKNPEWGKLYRLQQKPSDAHQGELGVIVHPDNKTISTEVSTTVQSPSGEWVNIPLLVKGQSKDAIQRILFGEPLPEDYDLAVRRFQERVKSGLKYTAYHSLQDAIYAAKNRSANKIKRETN